MLLAVLDKKMDCCCSRVCCNCGRRRRRRRWVVIPSNVDCFLVVDLDVDENVVVGVEEVIMATELSIRMKAEIDFMLPLPLLRFILRRSLQLTRAVAGGIGMTLLLSSLRGIRHHQHRLDATDLLLRCLRSDCSNIIPWCHGR